MLFIYINCMIVSEIKCCLFVIENSSRAHFKCNLMLINPLAHIDTKSRVKIMALHCLASRLNYWVEHDRLKTIFKGLISSFQWCTV